MLVAILKPSGPLPVETAMIDLSQFAFIDLEASGLGETSYPTEVGWAMIENQTIRSGSVLITPPPEWRNQPNSWSAQAEAMTGISQAMLAEHGLPPVEAFAQVNAVAGGTLLVSDNPEFDGPWLAMLAAAAVTPVELRFVDLDAVLNDVVWQGRKARLDRFEAVMAAERLVKRRHRAEDDAIRHAVAVGLLADQFSIDCMRSNLVDRDRSASPHSAGALQI